MINLDEIKARESKATPGPWTPNRVCGNYIKDSRHLMVGTVCSGSPKMNGKWISQNEKDGNLNFITHARTDISDLIKEIERLESELKTNAHMLAELTDCARENETLRAENEKLKNTNADLIHSNDELGIIAEQLRQENEKLNQSAIGPDARTIIIAQAHKIAYYESVIKDALTKQHLSDMRQIIIEAAQNFYTTGD